MADVQVILRLWPRVPRPVELSRTTESELRRRPLRLGTASMGEGEGETECKGDAGNSICKPIEPDSKGEVRRLTKSRRPPGRGSSTLSRLS